MAAKRLPRVCWDSNCWISLIVGTPDRLPGLRRVAEAARRGDLEIVTSFLAMAETAKGRTAPNDPASQTTLETIRAAFELDYLIPVLVDRSVAYRAQELLRKYKLRGAPGDPCRPPRTRVARRVQVRTSCSLLVKDRRRVLGPSARARRGPPGSIAPRPVRRRHPQFTGLRRACPG